MPGLAQLQLERGVRPHRDDFWKAQRERPGVAGLGVSDIDPRDEVLQDAESVFLGEDVPGELPE